MKNRGTGLALVAAGVILGSTISGPAASAAEMLAAQRSTQKIYVDGQQAQMEAYSINGSNYVKLRDIGKAVGFDVSWDAATNTVRIATDAPYGTKPRQRRRAAGSSRSRNRMRTSSCKPVTASAATMAHSTRSPT